MHWSYKVQVLFTSFLQERLFLQDARVTYKTGQFSFDFGQYIPKYSLEWTQPDYKIPAIERARVINTLSPNGTLGVRDIGV
jgi:phosphate-selective porin